jgi:heptosyltransferase-3
VLRASGFLLEAPRFDLHVPEEALTWAASAISENAVHLSINASTHLKEWPLRHWIGLVRILSRAYPRQTWIATCGPTDREQQRLRRFGAALNDERLLIMPKAMAIAQLAALLKRCRLHIGGDSGITHLAMALNIPTFSLFREYAGTREWLPPEKPHRHLTVACACAEQRFPDCLRRSEAACLATIPPQAVAAILREQLGE